MLLKDAEQFVNAVYTEILQRAPDPNGFSVLTQRCLTYGHDVVIKDVLTSSEFLNHHALKTLVTKAISSEVFSESNKENLEFVSLGTHSFTAWNLKHLGIKSFSAPFDWIFSSPEMIRHVLENSFNIFLDKDYHYENSITSRLRVDANISGHRFYEEHYNLPSIFNNYNVTNFENYNYLARCVQRFQSLKINDKKTVFIMVTENLELNPTLFLQLIEIISSYKTNFYFVGVKVEVFTHAVVYPGAPAIVMSSSNKGILIKYCSMSPLGPLTAVNMLDHSGIITMLAQIFAQVKSFPDE